MDANGGSADTILAIESFVFAWLEILCDPDNRALPSFEVPKRTKENVILAIDDQLGHQALAHGDIKVVKKLNRQGARSYTNILTVLEFAYRLLLQGKRATLREVYYSFKSGDAFLAIKSQSECDQAILDAAGLLGVARHELNIFASPKGLIAGRVSFLEPESGVEVDCQATSQGILLESYWLTQPVTFLSCSARLILVVEKETIFQRLVDSRFFDRVPCILITGKGVPDVVTRAALAQCWRILELEVVAITDCNPYGLALFLTYKIGSFRETSSQHFAVDARWLGLRPSQLATLNLPGESLQRLSGVDTQKCESMLRSEFVAANYHYKMEVEAMMESGIKCELEALHSVSLDHLLDFVTSAILHRDHI